MRNRVGSERRESGTNWTLGSTGEVVYVAPEPGPERARLWFFTRKGGVSEPPFDSLNISTKVPDDPTPLPKTAPGYAMRCTGESRPGYARLLVTASSGSAGQDSPGRPTHW